MNTLVIAEHDNSSLKGATLNTIAAAGIVSGDVTIIIAGQDIGSVIEEAQTLDGVNKILKCDNEVYANAIAEDLTSLIIANSDGSVSYTHLTLPTKA